METIQNSELEINSDVDSAELDTTLLLPELVHTPVDKKHYVAITFFLMGLSTLLPWSVFITATDYWMYKFRDPAKPHYSPDSTERTTLQTYFASSLAIVSSLPAFIVLIFAVHLTRIHEYFRVGASQLLIIIIVILNSLLIAADTDTWQTGFFIITMFAVICLNVFGAVFQSGVVGLTALFPEKYMHIMVTGQAMAGVFAAVAQIVTMLGNARPTYVATAYFLCAILAMIVTLLFYTGLHNTEVYKFYATTSPEEQQDQLSALIDGRYTMTPAPTSIILRKIWACALCIAMVFAVTIALVPGVVVLVVSSSPTTGPLTGRFFLPVTCFLLFNVGDFCGRLASGFIPMRSSRTLVQIQSSFSSHGHGTGRRDDLILLALSVLRIALVPLVMLCNAHPRSNLPVYFGDQYFIAFIALLGVTNGFLFCRAMMLGPKLVPISQQEKCGTILTLFLGVGLISGSIISFPLVKFI